MKYPRFFKRRNQIWKVRENGETLWINLQTDKMHYNGDAHIFFKSRLQFDESGAVEISQEEFDKSRTEHFDRLINF